MLRYCEACSRALKEGARFCEHCGCPVTEKAPVTGAGRAAYTPGRPPAQGAGLGGGTNSTPAQRTPYKYYLSCRIIPDSTPYITGTLTCVPDVDAATKMQMDQFTSSELVFDILCTQDKK